MYVTQIRQVATLLAMENHKSWKHLKTLFPQNYIGYCSYRRPKKSSRDSKENIDQGKNGQAADWTSFHQSIHKH